MYRPADKGVVAVHAGGLLGVEEDIAPEVVTGILSAAAVEERGALVGIPVTLPAVGPGRGMSPHYLLDCRSKGDGCCVATKRIVVGQPSEPKAYVQTEVSGQREVAEARMSPSTVVHVGLKEVSDNAADE